ncbi:hypothetical protein TRIUR3_22530 [Triticum urartu]|uniref:Uncharacterized protein n=1 Tax=Triticum urartu TaxID=4572 RepID=M8A7N5_TRIUA|nr:hypothetical protein TRIUR3_22530 [Triticum urartu]
MEHRHPAYASWRGLGAAVMLHGEDRRRNGEGGSCLDRWKWEADQAGRGGGCVIQIELGGVVVDLARRAGSDAELTTRRARWIYWRGERGRGIAQAVRAIMDDGLARDYGEEITRGV